MVLRVQAPAGTNRDLEFRSDTLTRWQLRCGNVAESGSDAGSDLLLSAYTDAGAFKGSIFAVSRATRVVNFATTPQVGGVDLITTTSGDARYAQLAAANNFTADQNINTISPRIYFKETDQAADETTWALRVNTKTLDLATFNDAKSTAVSGIALTRGTGTAIASIAIAATAVAITATTVNANGSPIITQTSGDARYAQLAAANSFTATQTIAGTTPALRFNETDAPTDGKVWDWRGTSGATSGSLVLRTMTDALRPAMTR